MPSVHVEHTLAILPGGKVMIITSDVGAFELELPRPIVATTPVPNPTQPV